MPDMPEDTIVKFLGSLREKTLKLKIPADKLNRILKLLDDLMKEYQDVND